MKASVPKVSADNLQPSNLRQQIPPYDTVYYFNQLIDHNQPSLGTFRQRYWHTWEFYRPGGPIILNTPGEVNAAGELQVLSSPPIPEHHQQGMRVT